MWIGNSNGPISCPWGTPHSSYFTLICYDIQQIEIWLINKGIWNMCTWDQVTLSIFVGYDY